MHIRIHVHIYTCPCAAHTNTCTCIHTCACTKTYITYKYTYAHGGAGPSRHIDQNTEPGDATLQCSGTVPESGHLLDVQVVGNGLPAFRQSGGRSECDGVLPFGAADGGRPRHVERRVTAPGGRQRQQLVGAHVLAPPLKHRCGQTTNKRSTAPYISFIRQL